jgi:hypothetical protein
VRRHLVEEPRYTAQLQAIGDIKALDESLRGIMWGIETNAEKYDLVPGFVILRCAKSWKAKVRMFFTIDPIQKDLVHLEWVEPLDEPGIFDDDDDE